MDMTAAHAYGPEFTWADRLRRLRRSLPGRPTQRNFAAALGLPAGTYGAWETGKVAPPMYVQVAVSERIANAYGEIVTLEWMLGGDHHDPAPATTAPTHLAIVGTDEDELLPRMDSNHQPPDQRSLPHHTWLDDEIPNYRSRTGENGRRTGRYAGMPYCANFQIRIRGTG